MLAKYLSRVRFPALAPVTPLSKAIDDWTYELEKFNHQLTKSVVESLNMEKNTVDIDDWRVTIYEAGSWSVAHLRCKKGHWPGQRSHKEGEIFCPQCFSGLPEKIKAFATIASFKG